MDFKIIWSDAALSDLEDICLYTAQDDPEAARIVAQVLRKARSISNEYRKLLPEALQRRRRP